MKISLLGCSSLMGLAAIGAVAFAPANASAADWTGAYVGANVGSAQSDFDVNLDTSTTGGMYAPSEVPAVEAIGSGTLSDSTTTFGVSGGFNWQTGAWVYGIEADIASINAGNSKTRTGNPFAPHPAPPYHATFDQTASLDWLATVRGRLGYDFGPIMAYATAGVAFGKVQFDNAETEFAPAGAGSGAGSASANDTATGWVAGLGVAHQYGEHWGVNAEYLRAELDGVGATGTITTGNSNTATHHYDTAFSSNIFRIGVTYGF